VDENEQICRGKVVHSVGLLNYAGKNFQMLVLVFFLVCIVTYDAVLYGLITLILPYIICT